MVTKFLSDDEVIMVAINLEDEGYKFYDSAVKASKSKESREIFQRLKDEEGEHKKIFKEMLNNLPPKDPKRYFDIKDEVAAYLNSLIETGVFKEKSPMDKISEIDALQMGIDAERDSILFYTSARDSSINPKGKEIMSKLIAVEKEHLVMLTNRLRIARKLF